MVANKSDSKAVSPFEVIVKAIGGRTRRVNLFDANVGEVQTRECIAKRQIYRVRIGEATTRLCIEILGFDTTLVFSVGQQCKIHFHVDQPSIGLPVPYLSIHIFAREDFASEELQTWLKNVDNLRLLQRLQCSCIHPLFVVPNGLHFVIGKNHAHVDQIDLLIEMAERLPRPQPNLTPGIAVVDGLEFDQKKLPGPLRVLTPYVLHWAVGDDGERDERIAAATPQEINKLLAHAAPLLKSIDDYLDSFEGEVMPNEAIVIGNLAELVAQLRNAQ